MTPSLKSKLIGINGVIPTSSMIATRKYPLTAEICVVTRKGLSADDPAAILRNWLLSADGQRLVASGGYIPISQPKPKAK